MSRRWTLTLLCVMLAITVISVSGEDHASLSNDDVTAAAVAAATGGAAASASTSSVQDASQSQPVKSDESAPHVQAVNVAKQYNDKYDEDEDQDDDFFLIPPPKPTQVTPPKEHKSIDERIAAQKFKIQQLQEQLSAQREKHAAAATLIAKRNKEIEKRMRKHAAEMTKAADIQRRRDALARAEKAEKARKAAAKRAAEIQAQQQVYALQKLLAQQSEAATLAERTLARQQQEDAIRKRVIATQHETYQQLEAELRAHEAEFGKHHHRHHHHHRLRQLQHRIQYMPFRTHPRHHHGHRHGRLSRRVTFTPRLSSNPFLRITPNPSWIPRRRLLGIRLRRWIIIQSIRARRAVPPPTTVPTITIARLQYQQARATARATLRAIVTRRVVQKRAALAAFRKFSQQIAITVTLARSALIHHKSHHHRHHGHHHRRHGHHHRYGRHHGHRHHGYGHGHDAYRVHHRPLYRRHHHGRHHGYHHSRHHHTPSASSPFQFQLVKNPYPTIVSTEELAPQQVAPHSAKRVSHSAALAA